MRRVLQLSREFCRVIGGILKELADENAYERYLRFHGLEHSPREWRRFSDEKMRAKFVRPKCC